MKTDEYRPVMYASVPDKQLFKNSRKLQDSFYGLLFLSERIKEKVEHTEYQQFSRAVAEIGDVVSFLNQGFETWCTQDDYKKLTKKIQKILIVKK